MVVKPWGWYLTLLDRKRFKVKLLYFKRGGAISKQRHKYRSELWCFIFGFGVWNKKHPVISGRYKIVNPKEWHHYKADKRTLVLEIQFGAACKEEDIERA